MAQEIEAALARQTVILPGTDMLELVLPHLADQLQLVRQVRGEVARRLPALLDQHPQSAVICSLPGFGPTLTARTLIELAGKEFASAAHLASYAGLAPVTRQSGTSIRHQARRKGGNRALRNAWYQAAYASLQHDRCYYDRKRQQGQHHVQALISLARRRVDVLYALLRDGTCYRSPAHPLA
jgi:transposase